MNNLQKLHATFNQSPWLDNLSRDLLESGQLQHYINDGIRGITSNPTILENAIMHSNLYDEQIKWFAGEGKTTEEIYWSIIEQDIKYAAELLRPIWESSNGTDGYVSLEVSPNLAEDAGSTLEQARTLWNTIGAPNLMIKVPATDQGIPVVSTLLSEGINVNVTLIFSLDHYKKVAEAHLSTHLLGMVNGARSVASFFVSRVDTEIDKRLTEIGTEEALALRGKAAVAQARLAYGIFLDNFSKLAVLDPNSAGIQKLLWASTSTKNPDYEDLLYVTGLIAPYTVNTLPEDTIAKILAHLPDSAINITLSEIHEAQRTFDALENIGINLKDVAKQLESEGIQKFQASFRSLLDAIEVKSKS